MAMAMVATSMAREALTPNPTMATVALPVCPPLPLWLSTAMPLLPCPPSWVAMLALAGMWLTPLAPSMWPRGRPTPTTMVAMAMEAMVWAMVAMVATTMARGALMLKLSPTTTVAMAMATMAMARGVLMLMLSPTTMVAMALAMAMVAMAMATMAMARGALMLMPS